MHKATQLRIIRMCVRPMRNDFFMMQYFPAKEAWAGEIQQTSPGQGQRRQQAAQQTSQGQRRQQAAH